MSGHFEHQLKEDWLIKSTLQCLDHR